MRVIIIKNLDTVEHVWGGMIFSASEEKTLYNENDVPLFTNDTEFFSDLGSGLADVSNGSSYYNNSTHAWDWLVGNYMEVTPLAPKLVIILLSILPVVGK